MSNENLTITDAKYCPKCEYFQQETAVCKKFYFNVRDSPGRFFKKCNGRFFELDKTKSVQEPKEIVLEEIEGISGQSVQSRGDGGWLIWIGFLFLINFLSYLFDWPFWVY